MKGGDEPSGAAEAELLKAAAFEAGPDPVLIVGPARQVRALNGAAVRLLGWPRQEAEGRPVAIVLGADIDGAAGGSSDPRRMLARSRDGLTIPVAVSTRAFEVSGDSHVAVHVRVLTGEADAERAAATATLLGGIAHELNNPLAVMLAQATLLRDRAPNADVESRAAKIEGAARRAGRTIREFLALTQHHEPMLVPLDLDRVIDDVLDNLATGLRDSGIVLERTRAPGSAMVDADANLLGQVLNHLLSEIQAVPQAHAGQRGVLVGTSLEEDRRVVSIGFAGTGTGPVRAGVGLSLCRSIVEAQGGELALEVTPDGGQRFRVSLPAAPVVATASDASPATLAILVVDDEIDVAQSLADLIEMFGHTVRVETTPETALACIRRQPFDGIFTDLHMPGLDGLALRKAVAAENPRLAARTAIVTGDRVRMVRDAARSTLPPDVLTLEKPFTADAVKATLARMSGP